MALGDTRSATAPATQRGPRAIVDLALASLPRFLVPNEPGIFCYERRLGAEQPLGRSLRYTLMVALGLQRALAAGYELTVDVNDVEQALNVELDSPELAPGDLGLYLWADARGRRGNGADLVARLDAALAANGGLGARLGMELGWIVTGLAHHVAAGGERRGEELLTAALDQLLDTNRAPSGLFRHHGDAGLRRRYPNFATQIYSVLALATVARHGLDQRALPTARAAADRLLNLQLPDGGWPWLFDAERGTVTERYEIYSVHQHAMAPMALLELSEVSEDRRYAEAAGHGLRWIWGANELRRTMVEEDAQMVLRSIRRRRGPDRVWLAAKTAASLAGLPAAGATARMTEVNPTDRPYSMGWVLEAWCGREDAPA